MLDDTIKSNDNTDGIDRRGFLKCMAWVGTGLIWSVNGGVLTSRAFGEEAAQSAAADFSFAQISDTHIGFAKEPNKDVIGTFQQAVARLNGQKDIPQFILHTGDLT